MQINKPNFPKAPQVLQNSHVPLKSPVKRPNTEFSSVDSCSGWIMIKFLYEPNSLVNTQYHIKQCKYRKTGMYVKHNIKHIFLADYLAFAIHLISKIERVKFRRLDISVFMNSGNKVYTQLGPLKRSVLSHGRPIDLNVFPDIRCIAAL
jgi:hypothetical protein